jgi:hypothetical protein
MSKLTGIFNAADIDQIPAADIAKWLRPSPGLENIENYIANKILYPETIPYSQLDLAIELALLREIARRYPQKFQKDGKILISSALAERIGTLPDLTLALVDVLQPKGVVEVLLDEKLIGNVKKEEQLLTIELNNKKYQFKR